MTIESARCRIRPFEEADVDDFMTYRNNLEWMRYQGFKGLNRQEYINRIVGRTSLQEGLQLAIICNQTNRLIGDIYLKEEGCIFWIGCTICPSKARQGYAYEVACAVLNELRSRKAICVKAGVKTDHVASIALLKKLKFQFLEMDGDEQIYILKFGEESVEPLFFEYCNE